MLPCEVAARDILPAIRCVLAERLVKEKGLSIYRTAKLLGITPAAVQNYVKNRRGSYMKEFLETDPKISQMIEEMLNILEKGRGDISDYYCMLCSESKGYLRKEGRFIGSCFYEETRAR
ncbi:transcriptional regulator [Sulfodiicoccus acidiphilus]|uniref:transcriptional regulator n=1 Tax=Sulfodiicoccus acidiphilus TaxID=1670455 RepID=UPI000F81749E|nr:transcriptional regulator [Sulfodiicoccus acidiphilus]